MLKFNFLVLTFLFFTSIIFASERYNDKPNVINISESEKIIEFTFSTESLANQFNNSTNKVFYYSISPSQTIQVKLLQENNFKHNPYFKNKYLPYYEDSVWLSEQSKLSNTTIQVKKYFWWRGLYLAVIELTSSIKLESIKFKISISSDKSQSQFIKQNKNEISEIEKQTILNYQSASQFIKISKDQNWFYSSQPYIKIGIVNDGVYNINLNDLKNFSSFPQNVNPKTFQLFNNGNEIPLFVSGEMDDKFDGNDYLEFPATKPYTNKHRVINYSESYNEYINRFTDTSWYWLTWGKNNGKRMGQNNLQTSTNDTLFSFNQIIHFEENTYIHILGDIVSKQVHNWNARKFPMWGYIFANQTVTQNVNLENLHIGNDSIKFFVKAGSFGANQFTAAHKLSVSINNFPPKDTFKVNKDDLVLVEGKIASNLITEANNTIKFNSYPTESNIVNDVIYDWFEVEYPKKLILQGDSLIFGFSNILQNSVKRIFISGFTDTNFVVYKYSPSVSKISNYQFIANQTNWSLTFIDSVNSTSKYFLWKKNKTLKPILIQKQSFADLISEKKQTDFILITHSKFKPEAENYKNFLTSEKKLSVRLIDVNDIYDEFAFGYPDHDAITKYLQTSSTWQLPFPKFLFLVGDASYDYKFVLKNKNAINYVPSIGFPVSDLAYAIWDDSVYLPQFSVGRLPVNNVGEVSQYLQFRSNYDKMPNNEWNKRALFFSSGNPQVSGQLESFRNINSNIVDKYFSSSPIYGSGVHFYKTANPYSDLGPYSGDFIRNEIGKGGLFISYIGHSGTQTWDNGIGDPVQLQNSVGRFSLMTDFGCSTGKFAEPQVKSFSELFLFGNSPSAISYIGNSSLGFVSIALTFPQIFYSTLLQDTFKTIGQVHVASKNKYLNQYGRGTISQILLFSNSLIGDPSVEIAIPRKPNFVLENKSVILPSFQLDDQMDSVQIKIAINNFGTSINDSTTYSIEQKFNNNVIRSKISKIKIPNLVDTVNFYILTKKLSGIHVLNIKIDEENNISEISESDNSITVNLSVITSDFLIVQPQPDNFGFVDELIFLNPLRDTIKNLELQLSLSSDFVNPINLNPIINNAISKVSTSTLLKNKRYFWRIREAAKNWTIGSFYLGSQTQTSNGSIDSIGFTNANLKDLSYSSNGIIVSKKNYSLKVISAGSLDGSYGVVEINGINIIQNSYFRGITIITIDTLTFDPLTQKIFDTYEVSADSDSLTSLINNFKSGTFVIAIAADEASRRLSSAARNALKLIGATKIDSLGFWDSYLLIGKKGNSAGSSIERYVKASFGKAIAETSVTISGFKGNYSSTLYQNLKTLDTLKLQSTKLEGTKIISRIFGQKFSSSNNTSSGFINSTLDTLITDSTLSIINLSKIDCSKYNGIIFNFELLSNIQLISPILQSWNFTTNYISDVTLIPSMVKLNKKIIPEGEIATIEAKFENLGISNTDSINVNFFSNDIGNDRLISNIKIPPLSKNGSYTFNSNYDSHKKRGSHKFTFQIDPDNKVRELFENNNSVSVNYSVIADTVKSITELTFDNESKISGDYISSEPTVNIKLFDNNASIISLKDTLLCKIYLDFQRVYYDGEILKFTPQNTNVKANISWKPKLSSGEHLFEFITTDIVGNPHDTVSLKLQVAKITEFINCYALPNPFTANTTFTFHFATPNIDGEISIKIYTISGRLIQSIDISTIDLNVGFNKVEWNGLDKDGDEIANGVYLYKLISNGKEQFSSQVNKLVKMK
ncbi:MAG: C25 family cysteine peptidase [Bacteroidetes bacterium]|nr:C25 family cysteine peptidase [Bacteroidota bacterium]